MDEILEQENFDKKNKTKKKKVDKKIIIGVIVFVIILLLFIYFGFIYKSAQSVYERSVRVAFDSFEKFITKSDKYHTGSGSGKVSYKITSENSMINEMLDILNGIDLAYQYQVDYKNNLYYIDINSNYQKKTLVDAIIYGNQDKIYLKLKDIYDKYFVSDVDTTDTSNLNYTNEDLVSLANCIEKAIIQSFQKDYFKREGFRKYVLELDRKKQQEFAISFLNYLKNDKEFIKTMAKMGAKKDDILSEFNDAIDQIKTQKISSTLKMVLYQDGFSSNISKIQIIDSKYTFTITKLDKISYQLDMKNNKKTLFTGKINIEHQEKDKKEQEKVSVVFNIPQFAKIKISLKNDVQYDTNFKKIDVQNSVRIEELTEQERQIITENLLKNEGMSLFIQHINDMVGLLSSTST